MIGATDLVPLPFFIEVAMNVKISYTVPFDRVPSKIDELLTEASRNLEGVGGMLKPNAFDEEGGSILQKLDLIEKTRKEMMTIDLVLEDCYTILAGYNKALADMRMPRKEETDGRLANEGRSSDNSTESGNG